MRPTRFAVVGAGRMARVRTRALQSTKTARLCGVAARHSDSARRFMQEHYGDFSTDCYRELSGCDIDAVLVEVPHKFQSEVVQWAIESGYHVLIGGCLSQSEAEARWIMRQAAERNLVVEAGYEARYKAVWKAARKYVNEGELGRVIAVNCVALWPGDPTTWYYNQEASGGMPLAHMTYAFVNPVRWIFGEPLYVSAFANQVKHRGDEMVSEETCTANMVFANDVICNMVAGYVKVGDTSSWRVDIIGCEGALEIHPTDMGAGSLRLFRETEVLDYDFQGSPNAFESQARVFCESLRGSNRCLNTPQATIGDVRVAEAIVLSARRREVVEMRSG